MLSVRQRAVEVMRHLVSDPAHGYSQYARYGDGTSMVVALSDGSTVIIAGGDRDCSSGVIDAWEAALPGSTGWASYTGNMRSGFISTGLWCWHPRGDGYVARPGDVYLNEGAHTGMCSSDYPDLIAEFSISETGGIWGEVGDQTGWESHEGDFYEFPWDGTLEYIGGNEAPQEVVEEPTVCGVPASVYSAWVRDVQREVTDSLSRYGLPGVNVTGVDGPGLEMAVTALLQCGLNTRGACLDVDGYIGTKTAERMGDYPVGLRHSEGGDDAYAIKCALVLAGWDVDLTTWDWDATCDEALRGHQEYFNLDPDGVCGPLTIRTLLPQAQGNL